jgi:hypothetical protein
MSLWYAPPEIQGERKTVLVAVRQQGPSLRFASEVLRADREVVLAAAARDGRSLEWAAQGLQGDRDVVLAAVASAGGSLRFASQQLQGDHEVVAIAVAQDGYAFRFASPRLRRNLRLKMIASAARLSQLRRRYLEEHQRSAARVRVGWSEFMEQHCRADWIKCSRAETSKSQGLLTQKGTAASAEVSAQLCEARRAFLRFCEERGETEAAVATAEARPRV